MSPIPILFAAWFIPAAVQAAGSAITLTRNWSGTLPIPDNNDVGASNTIVITDTGLNRIESVIVALEFEGGWNGDLYAYLFHNGQLSLLLNRPGRTATNDVGFGSTNLTVLFDDTAAGDVHLALPDSGPATGTYQPDGRITDPLLVLDTDARTKPLGVFNDADPNGDWTLFVADQGAGETAVLKSWSLTVTAVPEPSVSGLAGLATAALMLRRRREQTTNR